MYPITGLTTSDNYCIHDMRHCNQLNNQPSISSRLRNDLYCVEWGVKLYSLTHSPSIS